MPEEGRWCGDDVEIINHFFGEIDLATIGSRHDCQRAMWPPEAHEFDNPALFYPQLSLWLFNCDLARFVTIDVRCCY